MKPASIDKHRAKKNPWGLTAHQCMALRLMCKYGGAKRIAHATEISERTLEHHLHEARHLMGYFGPDVRAILSWYSWTINQAYLGEEHDKDQDQRPMAREGQQTS